MAALVSQGLKGRVKENILLVITALLLMLELLPFENRSFKYHSEVSQSCFLGITGQLIVVSNYVRFLIFDYFIPNLYYLLIRFFFLR